jgi:hypothetical protein
LVDIKPSLDSNKFFRNIDIKSILKYPEIEGF